MDVREIMRLAGAGSDAESFQVALEGTARPGYMAPDKTSRTELLEKRGYDRSMPRYDVASDRLYFRVRVGVDALGEIHRVLHVLWSALDKVRYGDDPETGFGAAAEKIQSGPVVAIEGLVKGLGFALDQNFDRAGEREQVLMGMLHMHGGNLDSLGLQLRGEIAEALAVLNVVGPEIDAASTQSLPELDKDLWKKAWPAFQKGISGRCDVLCTAIEALCAKQCAAPAMQEAQDPDLSAAEARLRESGKRDEVAEETGVVDGTGKVYRQSGSGPDVWFFVNGVAKDGLVPGLRVSATDTKARPSTAKTMDIGGLWKEIAKSELPKEVRTSFLKAGVSKKTLAEALETQVGQAFKQTVSGDEYWFLGTEATKSNTLKGGLVRILGGRVKQSRQSSLSASDLTGYQKVTLKNVPPAVLARWKESGALKEASDSLAEAAQGAVIVLKLRIPAEKSSMADEEPGKWQDAEERMASEFELNLERTTLKTEKAPKVTVKVTKVEFTGSHSKYELRATIELSGAGVSSDDDDLITALDKRAERALDDMILAGGVAAEKAFGETDWKHSEIDVM